MLALAVLFLVQLTVNAVRPMVSYRALALGAGTVELGVIAASFAQLSFALAVPVGRLIDRRGESAFIAVGVAVIAGVSFALIGAGSVVALVVTQACLALGAGVGVAALLLALCLLRAAPGRQAGSDAPRTTAPLRGTVIRVLRLPNIPHAMFASVAVLTTTDLLVAYLPAYGDTTGLSVTVVGLLLSAEQGHRWSLGSSSFP